MQTIAYGPHRDQVGDLHVPDDSVSNGGGPHPVVVIIHGGFWRDLYDRTYIKPMAYDLAGRGCAAWNLEFRRMGPEADGGFPMTLEDVAAGIDFLDQLAPEHDLDLDRVALVGHSAGGHLALWAAGRANPLVTPAAVFALAAVADLRLTQEMGLGAGAVELFMGAGPEEIPDAYAIASPTDRLPTGIRQVLIHGTNDESVPIDVARSYYRAARDAGEDVELLEFDTDHLSVVEASHPAWAAVLERLP